MTTEGALARSELSEEIRHRVAEPNASHHQDKRIAMFKALTVTHHKHVHATPETHIKRGAKLHHEPREQVINFHLRVGQADIDRKNHEEGHADHIRHGRHTKVTTLGKRPRERQGQGCSKRKVTGIGSLVHLGGHARPFPGAHARDKAHQANAAEVIKPQQEKYNRNGDKRRNQSLRKITHATPSQNVFHES